MESATVTDESGNPVDLKNLRPDGSLGDPEAEASEASEDSEPTEEPAEAAEGESKDA